jgi:hypothetical protein
MNVHATCLLEYLQSHGIEPLHVDSWTDGVAPLYDFGRQFPKIQVMPYIPWGAMLRLLELFNLPVPSFADPECQCDW